jgi:pyrroline-5-carboxylate reductase
MSFKLSDKKLAVLGSGKLGGILLRAYLEQGLFVAKRVTATVKHGEKAAALAKELGVAVTNDNRKAVKGADIILLGVKPQAVTELLNEIAPEIGRKGAACFRCGFRADELFGAAARCGKWRQG